MRRYWRPSARPGANIRLVGLDHSREHVNEGTTLRGCEDREDALLRGLGLRTHAVVKGSSCSREPQHARPAIRAVHGSFNQSLLFEPKDQRTDRRPIERHPFRERVLIEVRSVVDANHDAELQMTESGLFVCVHFGGHGGGDLVQAPCERDGMARRRMRDAKRSDRCGCERVRLSPSPI